MSPASSLPSLPSLQQKLLLPKLFLCSRGLLPEPLLGRGSKLGKRQRPEEGLLLQLLEHHQLLQGQAAQPARGTDRLGKALLCSGPSLRLPAPGTLVAHRDAREPLPRPGQAHPQGPCTRGPSAPRLVDQSPSAGVLEGSPRGLGRAKGRGGGRGGGGGGGGQTGHLRPQSQEAPGDQGTSTWGSPSQQ